jgi:uncharacterized protein YcnI
MIRRRLCRAAAVVGTIAALLVVGALPASAHVTVHADSTTPGATDVQVVFRVPNELDNAATARLQVLLPTDTPLLGVLVAPMPGWRSTVRTSTLAKPLQTDDGPVSEVTSEITWSGGRIPVGGYQDFAITVGQLPDRAGDLVFKAVQTYGNGTVVRWIETAAPGAAEPEHPAPILHLGAQTPAAAGSSISTPGAGPAADTSSSSDAVGRGLAIAALAVAAVSLVLSVIVLRRRRS